MYENVHVVIAYLDKDSYESFIGGIYKDIEEAEKCEKELHKMGYKKTTIQTQRVH